MDRATTPSRRSIVFVAGSGRSGTSMFSGLLQRLGYYVPQPEVEPDDSNPRGFAESRWVVDFHTRLLAEANVQTADARPTAWSDTLAVSNDNAADALRDFLSQQFAKADHVLIKDPRLVWFLPMWRRVAEDLGVTPRFVTMLRHPAAVIDSKSRHYGAWQRVSGDIGRTAGWVNTMLYTERATRDALRAYVHYDDLLEDWTKAINRVAQELTLSPVSEATATMIRNADAFVDPSLRRSSSSWEDLADLGIPATLRARADEVWDLLCRLSTDGDEQVLTALDEARQSYVRLYQESEGIAASSVTAAVRARPKRSQKAAQPRPAKATALRRLGRRLPPRVRRVILATMGRRTSARA
jgi:hypothetical protein